MKKMYWRPHKVSRFELCFVVLFALLGFWSVEHFRAAHEQPYLEEKLAASELTKRAFEAIRTERLSRGIPIDLKSDPANTGIIGWRVSAITSNTGVLKAKQTSVNPNFAGLVVDYLKEIGAKPGDWVAIGMSGSFPALNMATLAAVETLKLRPIIISSASASQYGANLPDFPWLEMERVLYERGIFHYRTIAASLGGTNDRGGGLSNQGRRILQDTLESNNIPEIESTSLQNSVDLRMEIFQRESQDTPYVAYINIGGGASSVGTHVGKKLYKPGLNRTAPHGVGVLDSVMNRFAYKNIPVIHLTQIRELAEEAGFADAPEVTPQPGEGSIFVTRVYNRFLAAGVAVLLIFLLFAVIRTDWGYRLMRMAGGATHRKPPEPMV